MQDPPLPSHPLKAVPIAVADEGESESEDDDLKPRGDSLWNNSLSAGREAPCALDTGRRDRWPTECGGFPGGSDHPAESSPVSAM